jgi:hypothetical protein
VLQHWLLLLRQGELLTQFAGQLQELVSQRCGAGQQGPGVPVAAVAAAGDSAQLLQLCQQLIQEVQLLLQVKGGCCCRVQPVFFPSLLGYKLRSLARKQLRTAARQGASMWGGGSCLARYSRTSSSTSLPVGPDAHINYAHVLFVCLCGRFVLVSACDMTGKKLVVCLRLLLTLLLFRLRLRLWLPVMCWVLPRVCLCLSLRVSCSGCWAR